jgi:hypothetical protein
MTKKQYSIVLVRDPSFQSQEGERCFSDLNIFLNKRLVLLLYNIAGNSDRWREETTERRFI